MECMPGNNPSLKVRWKTLNVSQDFNYHNPKQGQQGRKELRRQEPGCSNMKLKRNCYESKAVLIQHKIANGL